MTTSNWRTAHLVIGILAGTLASCSVLSLSYVNYQSALMIVIFNFLFVTINFTLKGTLAAKVLMLFLGNAVGLAWNYMFSLLAQVAVAQFGQFFNTLYMLANPFANLVWIVSFWSLSLTTLASSNKKSWD
jgi:hypothetical protein